MAKALWDKSLVSVQLFYAHILGGIVSADHNYIPEVIGINLVIKPCS